MALMDFYYVSTVRRVARAELSLLSIDINRLIQTVAIGQLWCFWKCWQMADYDISTSLLQQKNFCWRNRQIITGCTICFGPPNTKWNDLLNKLLILTTKFNMVGV